jgi:hypothetical protein
MSNNCTKFVQYIKILDKYKTLSGLLVKKGYIRKFISYNKFENNYTKIPDNYKKNKLTKKQKEKYCGSKKILSKNNNIYKKIKNKFKDCKYYYIHYNFSKTFLVYIKNKKVYVYTIPKKYYFEDKNLNYKKNIWKYIELIGKYNPTKIFIGKSIKTNITKKNKLYGSKYDGNSILLFLNNNKYIFIKDTEIYELNIPNNDKIIKFYSCIDNDDMSIPIAIGTKNIYFLNKYKYISNDNFSKNINYENIYNIKDFSIFDKKIHNIKKKSIFELFNLTNFMTILDIKKV